MAPAASARHGADEGRAEEVTSRSNRPNETAPAGAVFLSANSAPVGDCPEALRSGESTRARTDRGRRRAAKGPSGHLPAAAHQRPDAGQRVRAGRAGLHDGLRHHRTDQLRPRRGRDDRCDGGALGDHRAARARSLPLPAVLHHPRRAVRRHRRLHGDRLQHGEDRLPAAAQGAAPGAADHRDRHVDHPAERRADDLGPQLPHLPAAVRADAVQHLRRVDDRSADGDRRAGGAADGRTGIRRAAHPARAWRCARPRRTRRSRA